MTLYKRHSQTGVLISSPSDPGWRDAASYYHRFQFQRKTYLISLHTNRKADALKRAAQIQRDTITSVMAGNAEAVAIALGRRPAPPCSTVAKLETAYTENAFPESSLKTREQNIAALKRVLAVVAPDSTNPELSILARRMVENWFAEAVRRENLAPDQQAARSIRVSANSDMLKVASIFTPHNLPTLRRAGVQLPDLDGFLKAWKEHKLKLPRKEWMPPADAIIAAVLRDWLTLPREEFLAAGFALAFGLRQGEIVAARWDWLKETTGYHVLSASTDVKNGTGTLFVRALEPFYSLMIRRAENERWLEGDTVLAPNTAEATFRQLGKWMAAHGWRTMKKAHSLRAYAGCLVAKMFGLTDARDFLRHASVTVTESNYGYFLRQMRMVNPEDLRVLDAPVEWSRAQAKEFQPKIVANV